VKGRALYLACGVPAAILLFLLLTLFFTPNDAIKGVLVRAADQAGYTLDCTGFGKSFPLGLKARALELSSERGSLIRLRDVRVALRLAPLIAGKLQLSCRGAIGKGELTGEINLGRNRGWNLDCRDVRLEDIPFFTSVAEARVKGSLQVKGKLASQKGVDQGDLQLEVKSAELAGIKLGAMPLPDANYRTIRGALQIDKGKAVLKSFALDGDDIYVRLKGESTLAAPLGNSPLDLTMEMMPKPSFLERQKFIFLLLTRYQSSPGAYSVPIHGTLAHPAVM